MSIEQLYKKLLTFYNTKLLITSFSLTLAFQFVHEMGHVIVALLYGRKPTWGFLSLIQMWDKQPLVPSHWICSTYIPTGEQLCTRLGSPFGSNTEQAIMSAMGPLFSLLLCVIALYIYTKYKDNNKFISACLLISLLSTSLIFLRQYTSIVFSTNSSFGDEKAVAFFSGINVMYVVIPLLLFYGGMFVFTATQLFKQKIKPLGLGILFVGTILGGVFLSISHPVILDLVNRESPFAIPVLGFSLPVFIVNIVAVTLCFVNFVNSGNFEG